MSFHENSRAKTITFLLVTKLYYPYIVIDKDKEHDDLQKKIKNLNVVSTFMLAKI